MHKDNPLSPKKGLFSKGSFIFLKINILHIDTKSEIQYLFMFVKASPSRSPCFYAKTCRTKPNYDMEQDQKSPPEKKNTTHQTTKFAKGPPPSKEGKRELERELPFQYCTVAKQDFTLPHLSPLTFPPLVSLFSHLFL